MEHQLDNLLKANDSPSLADFVVALALTTGKHCSANDIEKALNQLKYSNKTRTVYNSRACPIQQMVHRQRMFDTSGFSSCSATRHNSIASMASIVRACTRTTAPALCLCFAPAHASLDAQSSSWSMQC